MNTPRTPRSSLRPSHGELFDIWLKAIRGDDAAKIKLFKLLQQFPDLQKSTKSFASNRLQAQRRQAKSLGLKNKRPIGKWEESSGKIPPTGAQVVSGGLPSLSKRSR